MRSEVARKALHLVSLVVPAAMLLLGREAALWGGGALAALAVSGDVLRARSVPFSRFINRFFGWMMRVEERPAAPGPVVVNGATWVLVTAFLLAMLLPLRVGMPVFMAFMLGDAAAALVGRRFGRIRWPGTRRTVEGSAAFFGVALAVLVAAPRLALAGGMPALVAAPGPGVAALVAATMAVVEALPIRLNDNVRVPLVGALLLAALLA